MYLGIAESDAMTVFTDDETSPFGFNDDGEVVLKNRTEENGMACAVFKLPPQ